MKRRKRIHLWPLLLLCLLPPSIENRGNRSLSFGHAKNPDRMYVKVRVNKGQEAALSAGKLVWRAIPDPLMRPQVIIKIDPALGGFQKVPQRPIGSALSNRLLEGANETSA